MFFCHKIHQFLCNPYLFIIHQEIEFGEPWIKPVQANLGIKFVSILLMMLLFYFFLFDLTIIVASTHIGKSMWDMLSMFYKLTDAV